MSKTAFRYLAICTLVAVLAAAWAIQRDWSQWGANVTGSKVFPQLADGLADVAQVKLRHRDTVITLVREPEGWIVVESDGFPARAKPIQELLFALSESRKLEAKTREPNRYERLYLEDPATPKARSKGIQVLDKEGNVLADLVLGKENLLLQTIGEGGAYLRIPGDPQTWLASGNLVASEEFLAWLDNPLIDIPRQRFEGASLRHPDGDTLIVGRSSEERGTFVLKNMGDDEELINEFYPSDIARAFENFEVSDARRAGKVAFPADRTISGTYRTTDGLTLTFDLTTADGEDWVRFKSVSTENRRSPEAAAEVEKIAKRSEGWAFRLPLHKSVHLKKDGAAVTKSTEKPS